MLSVSPLALPPFGAELAYAELLTTQSVSAVAAASMTPTPLTVSFSCSGLRPLVVEFEAPEVYNGTAGGQVVLDLYEGATWLYRSFVTSATANQILPCRGGRRIPSPAPGAHTYELKFASGSATTTANLYGTSPGAGIPAVWLRVREG